VQHVLEIFQSATFQKWFRKLRDPQAQAPMHGFVAFRSATSEMPSPLATASASYESTMAVDIACISSNAT
jgi:hypothetical protein